MESYIQPGIRVEVPFGKRKVYTALVQSTHHEAPKAYAAKDVIAITDETPIVHERQLSFWKWMSEYYCCHLGEVMQAALPAYFRLDSETVYMKAENYEGEILDLPDDEYLVASALEHQEQLTLEDIRLILQKKGVTKIIKSLLDKKVIVHQEFIEERYRPKMEVFCRLHPDYHSREQQHMAFNLLQRSPKQTDVLLAYLDMSRTGEWVKRGEVLSKAEVTGSVFKALVEKGIFEIEDRPVYRVKTESLHQDVVPLSQAQSEVLDSIESQFAEHSVVLLRGVTASGKTHVYTELIRKILSEGKQVLYLLPEISLTSQLIQRLEGMLGKVGVYHSKFNPAERVETWHKVLLEEYHVVVGARSAIFLPFKNLGLIIVDEEHDGSYKQQDPAPRYQARDCSIYVAHTFKAKVLLGSATPSLESWVNVQSGKYGYAVLDKRFSGMELPDLHFINMAKARKEQRVVGLISDELQAAMHHSLSKGRQVILFQNRRGYAPQLECHDCGWIPYCKNCDVSLTYHKYSDQLKCHYCGFSQSPPTSCQQCKSTHLEQKGSGTERVEDDLQVLFPDARILRMDYDTAKGKYAHEKIIAQFAEGEAEILVGTQMVTKGLDFSNVGLVGVLNADSLLHYPDFRAMERAWQVLHQVSGRAGRSEQKGEVYIQIGNPSHPITHYLRDQEPKQFYDNEWKERAKFHYPPYNRLIHISIRDKQEKTAHDAALFFYKQLHQRIQGECLGPGVPGLSRLKGLYLREILLKLPKNQAILNAAKVSIEEVRQLMFQYQAFKNVRILVDVDP